MAERVRGDVVWDGAIGRELRARGPVVQLIAVYLWTTLPPFGLGTVNCDDLSERLAVTGDEQAGAWWQLWEAGVALKEDRWVWIPELTRLSVHNGKDRLPYDDSRLVAARRWFAGISPTNPFRGQIHQRFGDAWGLPSLELLLPGPGPRALVSARQQAVFEDFALTPAPALFPEVLVDSRGLFERWWAEYPKARKVEKIKAFAVWQAIRPKLTEPVVDEMIKVLRAQAQSAEWLQEGGRFVPYPGRYLAKGRWMDDVTRAASVPRADVDNAIALADWLAEKRRMVLP